MEINPIPFQETLLFDLFLGVSYIISFILLTYILGIPFCKRDELGLIHVGRFLKGLWRLAYLGIISIFILNWLGIIKS